MSILPALLQKREVQREVRTIHVSSTYWKFVHPCKSCGKEGGTIAGVPTELDMRIPMTEEEHRKASNKAFYIGIDFEIDCNGGYSHIAKGLSKNGPNFYVSDSPGYKEGYFTEGESVEKALHKFIPYLVESEHLPKRLTW